jgi:class 3 adenylate cyclase/tetratricopeptide (TPR) repeat protein
MMGVCPSCAHEHREGARFCEGCGAPLEPAHLGEERKVVTTLFCDLVGFTATAERLDPEDVDRMLARYFAVARAQIEIYGGVVEKFIGDAVVGVFGVPAVHEDDPERAVRAGLRIVEDVEGLAPVGGAPLRVRIGINTGEVLVHLEIAPGSGAGFLRGDAVNTASRLQSIAPEMSVVVGASTYAATASTFDYEELGAATVKGKAEPLRVFHAMSASPRDSLDTTRYATTFIGRETELAILRKAFEDTVADSTVRVVTVTGEPGVGKTRIVAELARLLDARPGSITWLQGRCLPYGEGITFWALGEIVKARAGILGSDPPTVANAKLQAILPPGPDREWLRQRMLPLLGIEGTSTPARDELFTACRRFIELVAAERPTVLVFEDLHHADDAMLSFLEHLGGEVDDVALLIVGTARPEMLDRRPDFASGIGCHVPIFLQPLSAAESAGLVEALLGAASLPAELHASILERAAGNPLYTEELIRLLKDSGRFVGEGSPPAGGDVAEMPLPDSIHALIAARLDSLPAAQKAILADASVIGKVFWSGAVASMRGADEAVVLEGMRALSRKDLVHVFSRSSMEGETEYAFRHVLARDVAYAQLPRASRASRHVAAAAWIESKSSERLADVADVLADHYLSASELERATGRTEAAAGSEAAARRFLLLAGERALGLDTGASLRAFERALTLTPLGHHDRPHALARFGEAAVQSGRLEEASAALEEAIAAFRARGEVLAAARAMGILWRAWNGLDDPRVFDLARESVSLLEPLPQGPELLEALANVAANHYFAGEPDEGLDVTDRAIAVAAELGLPRPARVLGIRGMLRCLLGDAGGLDDYRDALNLAIRAGQGREAALVYNNLGGDLRNFEGPQTALQTFQEGLRFAEARGLREMATSIATNALLARLCAGEIDAVLASAPALAEQAAEAGDEVDLDEVRSVEALGHTFVGDIGSFASLPAYLVTVAGRARQIDRAASIRGDAVVALAALGKPEAAAPLLRWLATTPALDTGWDYAPHIPAIVRAAISLDESELAERLVAHLTPRNPYEEHSIVAAEASLAEARGDREASIAAYAEAVARWERFGVLPEQGFALLGEGRCLLGISRRAEAVPLLRQAEYVFARCGMVGAGADTEVMLESAATADP